MRKAALAFLRDVGGAARVGVGLLRAGLSAKGLKITRDIMRLNHKLGEIEQQQLRGVR